MDLISFSTNLQMKAQLHACKEVHSHKIFEEKENQKNKFSN